MQHFKQFFQTQRERAERKSLLESEVVESPELKARRRYVLFCGLAVVCGSFAMLAVGSYLYDEIADRHPKIRANWPECQDQEEQIAFEECVHDKQAVALITFSIGAISSFCVSPCIITYFLYQFCAYAIRRCCAKFENDNTIQHVNTAIANHGSLNL